MSIQQIKLKAILFALPKLFSLKAKGSARFREYLNLRKCNVQIKLADNSIARYYEFNYGKISSKSGLHASPDMVMIFKDIDTALSLMGASIDYAELIHAGKNFRTILQGDDEVIAWFGQLAANLQSDGWKMGKTLPDGTQQFMQMTNGGPLRVDVKDNKIIRTSILQLDDLDPQPWEIKARGRTFKPRRK